MKVKLGTLSRKATAAAIGGALALAGVGVGTAAVLSPTSTAPASDQTEVTEPAATSAEPTEAEPTQAATVVEQSEQAAPTSTVPGVTSNQQAPAPVPADEDRSGIGTTGADGNYTPAPPIQRPGEPPVAPPPPLPIPEQPVSPPYSLG